MSDEVAVVTGASSGIGAATARMLSEAGFKVIVGARRIDKLQKLAQDIGAKAFYLDVTDPASVQEFCSQVSNCSVLINNAGVALGLDPITELPYERMLEMYERNVIGTVRMTQALLAQLIANGNGRIVNIGSIAGHNVYFGGGGYTATKHGLKAITKTLRGELLGQPVRIIEVDPGLVETELFLVRFDGDKQRVDEVYRGMTPLSADDVAECVVWAVTRPPHVNIDQILVTPRDQVVGFGQQIHRQS